MEERHVPESPFEVVFDHLHARGAGDADAVAARLHPDIVQQGSSPSSSAADAPWCCAGSARTWRARMAASSGSS